MGPIGPVADSEKPAEKATAKCWLALIVGMFASIGICYVPGICGSDEGLTSQESAAIELSDHSLSELSDIVAECAWNSPNLRGASRESIALASNSEELATAIELSVVQGIASRDSVFDIAVACEAGIIEHTNFDF